MLRRLKPAPVDRMIASFVVIALTGACGLFESAPVLSALEKIAPYGADAISKLVADRWGADAQIVDPGCFPAADDIADDFGDDDREYVYSVCRAKSE